MSQYPLLLDELETKPKIVMKHCFILRRENNLGQTIRANTDVIIDDTIVRKIFLAYFQFGGGGWLGFLQLAGRNSKH